MRRGKFAAALAGIMLGVCAFGGCGEGEEKPSSPKDNYDVMGLNAIPVGIYVTPDDAHREQKYFDYMSEAGINFINGFRWYEDTDEEVMTCLNYSEVAGLRFLVNDKRILDNIETYFTTKNPLLIEESMAQVQKYVEHPAYGGQFFIDEPWRGQLEDLAEFTKAYDSLFGKFWSINHFGANVENLGCTYEQFIDDYFELTNASMYSFDTYPLLEFDENDPAAHGEMDGFFYGLDLIRSKTLEKKAPFWAYVQTLGIGANGILQKRTPDREDIRWNVFINLAFGAKGIQYFTYFTPGSGSETFTEGMIGLDGEKTERYEYVKEVDLEFHKYGEILLHCDAEGIIYNKQSSNRRYRLYEEKLESYGSVTSVDGDSFVAGCFKHTGSGKNYLFITPPTPRDSAAATLKISGKSSVNAWIKGEKKQFEVKNGEVTFQIADGDAVLVEV